MVRLTITRPFARRIRSPDVSSAGQGVPAGPSSRRYTGRMTKLLENAIEQIAKLPESEQDAVAAVLLEELASERRWAHALAGSQEKLARLAQEALAEYEAGRTKPL